MEQERIFYHGSIIGGLDTILANSKSHTDGSRVAYFTEDRVYALVCCRSREENLVTMGPRDGVQHYFERFPDQLRVIYGGKEDLSTVRFRPAPWSTPGIIPGKAMRMYPWCCMNMCRMFMPRSWEKKKPGMWSSTAMMRSTPQHRRITRTTCGIMP